MRTRSVSIRFAAWPALLALLFVSLASFAQQISGGLEGTVTDSSGASVPQAKVEVSGGSLVQPLSVNTDKNGAYSFPSLPPGSYTVSAAATGFSETRQGNIPVQASKVARVDVQLQVGSMSQRVDVEAASAVIDTVTNVVETSINSQIYDVLPKGRGFDSLIALAPGVRNEPKSGQYSADGASGSENTFLLDGAEVGDITSGTLRQQTSVPVEWISETTVKSSGMDAQERSATGGVVEAITKSGSNSFHGQILLYGRFSAFEPTQDRSTLRLDPNDDLAAQYFTYQKDGFRSLNPGYELGGPIWKQKLWFYSSYIPILNNTTRNVTFTSGENAVYKQNTRQDFWFNRVDFAPFERLRLYANYSYNPYKVNGLLPTQQGTDSFANPWADRGNRTPYTSYNYNATWTANSRFVLTGFGGYTYRNYKDYGVPRGTYYYYAAPSNGIAGVPPEFQSTIGQFTANNQQTLQDIAERTNVAIIGDYLLNAGGQHHIKGGWELYRLSSDPQASAYPDGRIYAYWDRPYSAITKPGSYRGAYGYYASRPFVTQGNVHSNNQGVFLNDSWRVSKRLTLNLGVRLDHEFVPSFSSRTDIPSTAIDFPFTSKVAPRIGFAWDITGKGKQKLSGGWGLYYDTMKYSLPRGSFGGDYWVDSYYTLDSPNIFGIQPTPGDPFSRTGTFPGTLIESLDRRIPSNDPANNLIERNLKPMRTQDLDFTYELSLTSNWLVSARYGHKYLDHAIEDVGLLTDQGEQYFIANPGYGITQDLSVFPDGFKLTPRAKRQYDAMELKVVHRFSNWFLNASYTYSRLYGNYAGLGNSDEPADTTGTGRTDPNASRAFDLPWSSYDDQGRAVYGRLATDRPHTLKLFASYSKKWKFGETTVGPSFVAYSGTPLTTDFSVDGVPVYAFGRGNLGRTPIFSQTDLLVMHDIPVKWREGMRLRLEFNALNIMNQASVLNAWTSYVQPNQGGGNITFDDQAQIFRGFDPLALVSQQGLIKDPRFGQPNAFQSPRDIRFGLHFFF